MDNADAQEVVVDLGFDFIPPLFAIYSARRDTERENEECLVVELSVNEEELEDERDRGQVDFVRKVALARLREPRRFFYLFVRSVLQFNIKTMNETFRSEQVMVCYCLNNGTQHRNLNRLC